MFTSQNLSICHSQLTEWAKAIYHASQAIEVQSNTSKVLYIRGKAYLELAKADLMKAEQLEPNNADVLHALQQLSQPPF